MAEPMASADSEALTARRQLERVIASSGFARNERLSRFLRFVVERHLEGRDHELKESVIAVEIFGRSPDYDPKHDPIVRTEAGRLRARLAEYYIGEGAGDALVIELPKGGYIPRFRAPKPAPVTGGGVRKARSQRLWLGIALAGLAVTLAAMGRWWVQHKGAPVAVAVLPLENLSHDPADDYFADGLTDELIRNLSLIDGLAPRSRSSAFAFRGKPLNVREVGRQLEVEYILEGSILRAGQQLRINVQLIRVRDDYPLWSARYDRTLTDVFTIQDEISRGIVNNLRLKLGRTRRRYETSTDAYDLYLRARALTWRQNIRPFEEAITKDPSFAPAYAGLAATYAFRAGLPVRDEIFPRRGWAVSEPAIVDRADELAKMRAAAQKAIQLDPLLAEAHDALGIASARDGQWEQSEKSFRRALELDPSRSMSYVHFARYLLKALGRRDEALQQLRAAEKTDPRSPEVENELADALISVGRYDEAASHCEKLPAGYTQTNLCVARARLGQERTGEAIRILATGVGRPIERAELGYAYARVGRREEAEKLAAELSPNPYQEAMIYAGLGDKERTWEALERMSALGPLRIGWALAYPEFALVGGDPRLKALRRKVGLPE
jgi:TolB-like protein